MTFGMGSDKYDGIRVDDISVFGFVNMVLRENGLHIPKISFNDDILHEKLYDKQCFLFNGTIVVYGQIKKDHLKAQEVMHYPMEMIKIIGEDKQRRIDSAKKLQLPLEDIVK